MTKKDRAESPSQRSSELRNPLVERQGLFIYVGMSEEEWEVAVNISNTEWIAPEFSTELDAQLKRRFGLREQVDKFEFWNAVKAIAVPKDITKGNGGGGEYVPVL